MVVSCVVVGCTNRSKKDCGIKFHRIPLEAERRKKWLQSINRKKLTPHSADRVCGTHFVSGSASCNKTDPDYIPHVDMGYQTPSVLMSPEAQKDRYSRVIRREGEKNLKIIKKVHEENRDCAASALMGLFQQQVDTVSDTSDGTLEKENLLRSDIHDPCLRKITALKRKNRQLLDELQVLKDELRDTKENGGVKFCDSFLSGHNKDTRTLFYTGIPNYATFLWLVQYCYSTLPTSAILNPATIVMMTLMKLRHNFSNQDLGYRLGVSLTHIGDLLNKSLPSIAKMLAFLVHWPDKEEVLRHMPKVIKGMYRKCRVIIDCCEIFIERPGNLTIRGMTWSNYKSHNTIKILVAISTVGGVSFVSRTFGGRTSDKIITQRSGFLQLLEHGDLVLADRVFLISDELAACGAQLAIPAFTRGKSQLSPKEIECGRQLSCVRIHVERAIERIKNFKILNTTMNISLVPHSDSIITICSAITNLQPKLVG